MTIRVVGAGLPRTGTTSASEALARLLGEPCYHMREVILNHLDHAPTWRDAMRGALPDWDEFLGGYAAAVDWPPAVFWRELSTTYPDAVVLLTCRDTGADWAHSMQRTVLPSARRFTEERSWRPDSAEWRGSPAEAQSPFAKASSEQLDAFVEMFAMFRASLPGEDEDTLAAHHDRHLAEVRAAVPADRLVELRTGQGWEPLCAALGVPVPDEPYPRTNTSEEWAQRVRSRSRS